MTGMLYFIEAARSRSFTEAAEALHITQQALSAHMAALESELGCRLLVRRVPLRLTPEGREFLSYALSVCQKTEAVKRRIADMQHEPAGTLSIGIAPARGRFLLPPVIAAFQKQYPKVRVHIEEAANERLIEALEKGQLDLGIAAFPATPGVLSFAPFYEERMALVVSPSLLAAVYGERAEQVFGEVKAGQLSALDRCPFLMNSRDNIAGSMGRKLLSKAGAAPVVLVESENLETLMELSAAGHGAFFCPANLAASMAGRESVRILPIPGTSYEIRFGWRRDEGAWEARRRFVELAGRTAAWSVSQERSLHDI